MKTLVSCIVALVAAASTLIMYYYNTTLGIVQTILVLVLGFAALYTFVIKTQRLRENVQRASKYFANPGGVADFPMPAVITDNDGSIVWYNEFFSTEVLGDRVITTGNIEELLGVSSFLSVFTASKGMDIVYDERKYTVYAEAIGGVDKPTYCFFFIDNTDLKRIAEEYHNTRPVVMQMKIDNLDEVYQNYKNSECEVISGELEHILEAWANEYPCVFRRVSSGKYVCVMEERGLSDMCAKKFDVLKKVRDYKYGGIDKCVDITVSIGVGRGATMTECDENSKQALEMSQSRGGDQATINTDGSLEFYGGTVAGSTKRTKIKARIIATAFADHISNADTVFVMGHYFSDLDSVGASVGVYSIVKALGKKCFIVTNKETSMAKNLIEGLDEKAIPGAFITGDKAKDLITSKGLLVIVDTHRPETLDYKELLPEFENVVVIDHHRRTADYINSAVLYYDEPNASSACELVTEIIQYTPAKVQLHPMCAEALLSGIMLDTRNFVLSTGARTFEAAAYLKSNGADTVSVKQFFANSFDNYKQKNAIVSTAVTYKDSAVAVATEQSKDIRIIASQVANELLNVAGVKASYVLFEENGQINISARSLGERNVQVIMERLGGGGHLSMAATQLSGITMGDAVVKLEEAINEFYEEL